MNCAPMKHDDQLPSRPGSRSAERAKARRGAGGPGSTCVPFEANPSPAGQRQGSTASMQNGPKDYWKCRYDEELASAAISETAEQRAVHHRLAGYCWSMHLWSDATEANPGGCEEAERPISSRPRIAWNS